MKINSMNKQGSEAILLIDHLQAMHQLIEKRAEYKIPLYLVFVNYCKAFDSVEVLAVLEAIQHHGVDPICINILKHIYQNATSFIPSWTERK